ncbi:MAG: SpoU rRNA Methylase family, partial [Clostridia bacterium]|nr:SpoU rRNA Methylase family [Clostridia bacterium]
DIKVKIPLDPRAESLNVAVAGAIILYEIVRQRMV